MIVRMREREREREHQLHNSANRRWQIYRACFIGAICTQRDAGGLQWEGGKMGDGGDGSHSENMGTSRLRARYRIIYVCT